MVDKCIHFENLATLFAERVKYLDLQTDMFIMQMEHEKEIDKLEDEIKRLEEIIKQHKRDKEKEYSESLKRMRESIA